MDLRIWRSVDGHLFVSVPTELPEIWRRIERGLVSGQFEIVRTRADKKRDNTYDLFRLGVRIGFTMSTEKAAKAHALLNAHGKDRVNVA